MMKRMISFLMILTMLLGAVTGAVSIGAAAVAGDADGDGALSILDATAIQRHLAGIITLSDSAIESAKVTGDPTLSILDATAIQRKLAGIITAFPVEEAAEPTVPDVTDPTQDTPAEAPTAEPTTAPTDPATEPVTDPATETVTDPATEPATESPVQPQDEVTKVKDEITIYFSNNKQWQTVNAYVYSDVTGAQMAAWPGTKMKLLKINDIGEEVYSMTVDVTQYDRIIFNNGSDQTTNIPVTKASSGFFLDTIGKGKAYSGKYIAGVYPYGQDGEGKVTAITMDYPDGYKKKVYIWTPEGYDPADKTKKYHVLYMCDGQNLFGQANTLSGYEWECDETVLSMMGNGGDGVIVVGVEAGNTEARRNHELTPNLGNISAIASGDPSYSNGGGEVFSDFVVDTVIPYVESHYNVSSVRGVAGSSSGGIEAFYIGMEHRDLFRFIGALSPAFILYDKATWDRYLSAMDFSKDTPRIYFYCGNSPQDQLEQALYTESVAMQGWLEAKGYPADLMRTTEDDDAVHNEGFWALYFPEALSWGLDL